MQQNIYRLQAHDDKKQHVTIKDSKLVGGSTHKLVQVRANFPVRFKQTPSLFFLKSNIEPVWNERLQRLRRVVFHGHGTTHWYQCRPLF